MKEDLAGLDRLTRELKQCSRTAFVQFTSRTQRPDYKTDFYGTVKPFADHVQKLIDQWRPLAEDWLKSHRPKYVYPIQIKNTYDNLAIICVTAFQKDTRRRRFVETVKAIDYVLDNILSDLNQERDLTLHPNE